MSVYWTKYSTYTYIRRRKQVSQEVVVVVVRQQGALITMLSDTLHRYASICICMKVYGRILLKYFIVLLARESAPKVSCTLKCYTMVGGNNSTKK